MKKIAIAADHAGYEMKEFLVGYISSLGYEVFDFGTHSPESMDYPDVGHPLGEAISRGEFERAISLCGSGVGIGVVVNKHAGVRGALCWEPQIAELSRRHNDANILCLPARFMENTVAAQCVDAFLTTKFEGDRHKARIEKIEPLPHGNHPPVAL